MNPSSDEGLAGMAITSGSSDTPGRRRANSSIHGGLLGIWWASGVIIAIWGEQLLWRLADAYVALPPFVGAAAISRLSEQIGVSLFAFMSMAILAFAAIGAAGGCALTLLGQHLRPDPQQTSQRALIDALGQWRPTLLWAMPVLLVFLIVLFVDTDDRSSTARLWLYGSVRALVLLSPFLVFNRVVLECPSRSRLWLPKWPGWRIVAAGSSIAVIEALIEFALNLVPSASSPAFSVLTEPVSWIVSAFASAMLCAAWIDREGFRGFLYPWRNGHSWRVVGPFLALSIRLGIVMLWLLPLVLVPSVLLIFIVPSVASVLEANGEALPCALRWNRIWAENCLVVLSALGTMITFETGRTYVLASPSVPDRRMEAPATHAAQG
jgi:hypothetical protein